MRTTTLFSTGVLLAISLVLAPANGAEGKAAAAAQRGPCGDTKIEYGDTRTALIAAPGLSCLYSFTGQTNDTVKIMLRRTGKWDPFLVLLKADNKTVLAQDDDSLGDDNSIINFRLPSSGQYTIEAASSNDESAGRFELELLGGAKLLQPTVTVVGTAASGPGVRRTPVPTLTPTPAPSLPAKGQVQRGSITARTPELRYTFAGDEGDRVYIRMISSSKGLDPWLDLLGPDGGYEISDDDGAGNGNSKIWGYKLLSKGTYTIVARSYENKSTGDFELALSLK